MMTRYSTPGPFHLGARQMVELPDTAGLRMACTSGSLWITLDHDPRDIVLEPGQCFDGTAGRRAIVYALEPSRLTVAPVPVQARSGAAQRPLHTAGARAMQATLEAGVTPA